MRQRTHSILVLRPQYYQRSFPRESVPLTWKGENRMVPSPDCKPDVVATSLHRIPPASVEFFWKYEAWHYLAGTTRGFCWLMRDIFLLKLCTFDPIVHNIIQNSSICSLVQVRSGKHSRNSTFVSKLLRFTTGCDFICLDYVDRSIFCNMLRFVGRNAGPRDLQEVICKLSHVLLLVLLSNGGELHCIFGLSSLIDEDDAI